MTNVLDRCQDELLQTVLSFLAFTWNRIMWNNKKNPLHWTVKILSGNGEMYGVLVCCKSNWKMELRNAQKLFSKPKNSVRNNTLAVYFFLSWVILSVTRYLLVYLTDLKSVQSHGIHKLRHFKKHFRLLELMKIVLAEWKKSVQDINSCLYYKFQSNSGITWQIVQEGFLLVCQD